MKESWKRQYIDITIPVRSGMVHWPGDPEVIVENTHSIGSGDEYTVSRISMGSHTGTHMDAPCHFLEHGACIDVLPLGAVAGPARVVFIEDRESIKPDELAVHGIASGERILFKTANSLREWDRDGFNPDFVYISHEAAGFLAEMGVRTVGIDSLSVGGYYRDAQETHTILLSSGIWIIEGLNLSKAEPGEYDLVCLPLKILHGDGAPARAVLFPSGTFCSGGDA